MPKYYIYTVTSKQTGAVVVEGPISKCAEVTGLTTDTLRDMALNKRDTYITPGRRKYKVTRGSELHMPPANTNWYSVYDKGTDELLASGTAAECAKALGWKTTNTLYRTITRERRSGSTHYEFYSEPYYENDDE